MQQATNRVSQQSRGGQILPGVALSSRDLRFRFSRSSGPGGQNVNKVNTKATMYIDEGVLADALGQVVLGRLQQIAVRYMTKSRLVISSESHRSQGANRRACMAKLRDLIIRARHRPRLRYRTLPSASSIKRRLRTKQHQSRIKALRRQSSIER